MDLIICVVAPCIYSSEDRSQNELYLLEELLTDVKFICDLPLAKRLEVNPKSFHVINIMSVICNHIGILSMSYNIL